MIKLKEIQEVVAILMISNPTRVSLTNEGKIALKRTSFVRITPQIANPRMGGSICPKRGNA